ncbi:YbgC/FadM family acyl-CoA thioesterase [Novosphingobium mangrovi (ex Huang et al. 2023)]|uniref:YbgC/FadM family acyl-CoA thioesterase n=1 Tax=Novosphingobium mangrovi (ex Huang et al. 2023) TaxID=2976432 RepID=A0ABT2HZP2_9SPHN|nr:YbgC/FadM family acyl-CoA thioesterase [Novosphingobium mangrovi (ex Huang et al. 2023)]MCT2398011.1 YbgC/FadM family acyl-CoA thioesterase [Novosphingobium mangrovi (ex Huang et al. 2023)]
MTAFPQPDKGVIDGDTHRYALRVFYEDTDAGGVVYHANYLRWFERARSDLVELLGIDQRASLESGEGVYTVAELTIRYLSPARLGDTVVLETTACQVGRVSCTLRQAALRGGVRLAEATVKVGFIGPDGRPRRQPAAWRDAFALLLGTPDSGRRTGPEGQE